MSDICFYCHDKVMSFDRFCQDVFQARQVIKKTSGNNVLLFDSDSYQFSIWLFALIFENKHVLLPPNAQEGTLARLAAQCDATAGTIKLADKKHLELLVLEDDTSVHFPRLTREAFFEDFSGEMTFFTSGSTGQAKSIRKNCEQLILEIKTLTGEFSTLFNQVNTIVSTVSHQHIYGLLFKILLPLFSGKVIVNQTFEYPEHINHLISALALTKPLGSKNNVVLVSSPAHLQRLALDNVLVANSPVFSAIFSSGGLLSLATSQALLQQMNISVTEVYGSTETGGIAWRRGQQAINEPWQAFSNIKLQVSVDRQRLAIFSPYVIEQPYLTDDKAQLLDSGQFLLNGRVDRTVKIEEKRVNLNQIEQHLIAHSGVLEARVMVINNGSDSDRQILAAVLVLSPAGQQWLLEKGKLAFSKGLKQYLLNDIERICLPKKWRYLAEFPYNSQGKLVLSDLEKLFE